MSERLRPFLVAMLEAERSGNNYAAIALALTIPDICGSIDQPGPGKSQKRYIEWWDGYAAPLFDNLYPGQDHAPLIAGQDAWALRNAFLHAGQDKLSGPGGARRVRFIHSHIGSLGGDSVSGTAYLSVDLFVRAVNYAVERWLEDRSEDGDAQARMGDLLEIMAPDDFYDTFIDHFSVG